MATTAQFANAPRVDRAVLTTANTNRDGTGAIVDCFTGGTSGSRVERVRIKANVTTTTGSIVMYLYNPVTSPTHEVFQEVLVSAATPSATVASFSADMVFGTANPLDIPSGWKLGFSTTKSEEFIVTVIGSDY